MVRDIVDDTSHLKHLPTMETKILIIRISKWYGLNVHFQTYSKFLIMLNIIIKEAKLET